MKNKITVADLIMGAGGIITFIFSFLAFYKYGDTSINAWDDQGAAFASTLPAILGLAMAVWIALEMAGVSLPEEVLTYNRAQLKGTWGIAAGGIMLSWLSTDPDKGAGFWLMLVGSLAMAVGAVMALLGKGTEVVNIGSSSSAPTTASSSTAAEPITPPPPPPAP
jgi:hypothetical protein